MNNDVNKEATMSDVKRDPLKVGSKVKFMSEKQRYTVQASDHRFAVCTKPMNALKTVLYTIIDFQEDVRGPENLIFGMGAESRELCEEMLDRLNGRRDPEEQKRLEEVYSKAGLSLADIPGEFASEVSHRHRCGLDIECIDAPESTNA